MGLINLEPTLRVGEEVQWRRPAAHSLEDRAVTGTLFLTTLGLVFMPNRLNRRRDLVSERIPHDDIVEVGVEDRAPSLASRKNGGLQRRLRVQTRHGDVHLFVIRHPDEVAAELGEALDAGR
jgi:ribosomal protein L17